MSRPTHEEQLEEQTLTFMNETTIALQAIAAALEKWNESGAEISKKLDRLIELAEAPAQVVHLHQTQPLYTEREP